MAPEGLQKGRFQSPHCSHASRGKKSHRSPGHDGEIRHTAGDDGFGCAPYTDSGQGPGRTLGSRAREVSEGAGTGRGSQTPREERRETRGKTRLGDRSLDSGTRLGIWDPDRRPSPHTHTPRARERGGRRGTEVPAPGSATPGHAVRTGRRRRLRCPGHVHTARWRARRPHPQAPSKSGRPARARATGNRNPGSSRNPQSASSGDNFPRPRGGRAHTRGGAAPGP